MAKKADAKTATPKNSQKITTSSTAEYFSKNLQQVGFSSQTKAVLTTLKEAVDNVVLNMPLTVPKSPVCKTRPAISRTVYSSDSEPSRLN